MASKKKPPRRHADDLRGASRMVVDATKRVTEVVEGMHRTIASGPAVLGAPLELPARAITGLVYGSIRGVTHAVGFAIDAVLSQLAPLLGESVPGAERAAVLSALNGVVGDYLQETGNALAIEMCLCHGGKPLELEGVALRAALPDCGGRVLVLAHGCGMNDLEWSRAGHDHGASLARDLGFTAIYLRYNSGLHISTNGAAFAAILERLAREWPVPITELVIVGHSMGGLVARSACHASEASGHAWRRSLKRLVCIGSPHHGAPLERGGNWIDRLLGISRYSAPLAQLGKLRSAGVTDLRHGCVLDEDWVGRDRFASGADPRRSLGLPEGVECYAIAGTLTGAPAKKLRGDGLVPVDSALGRHPRTPLGFPEDHQWIGYGIAHLDLLSRTEVYETIRAWLSREELLMGGWSRRTVAVVAATVVAGCTSLLGIEDVVPPDAGLGDAASDATTKPATDATTDARTPGRDAGDAASDTGADAAGEGGALTDQDAAPPIFTVATGYDIDSIVSDGTKVYWREGSQLPSDGASEFYVTLKSCPISGACAAGGDVMGGALSTLVFYSDHGLTIVGTTLFATTGDTVVSCSLAGCGGNLATVYTNDGTGTITSLTSAGRTLLLAKSGPVGDRFLWACDIANCASPTSLIATQAAPGDPSLAAGLVAFHANGLYVCSISTGCPDGAAPIATFGGTLGGSLWNDGTNVYFTLSGTAGLNDAGYSYIANDTGTLGRCGVSGCGGVPTVLGTKLSQPGSIVVDGTDLYWINAGSFDIDTYAPTAPGSVQRCSTTDECKTVETLATGGSPSCLTLDATNLYWGDGITGTISARAKH